MLLIVIVHVIEFEDGGCREKEELLTISIVKEELRARESIKFEWQLLEQLEPPVATNTGLNSSKYDDFSYFYLVLDQAFAKNYAYLLFII